MTHKRKANHANGLEYTRPDEGITLGRVALKVWGDVRALDEHRGNDDEHANEREPGGARELVDVAVEGERVGNADGAEGDDELAVGEPGEDGDGVEGREGRTDYVGYSVS